MRVRECVGGCVSEREKLCMGGCVLQEGTRACVCACVCMRGWV